MKVMRCFPVAVQLAEKLHRETAWENFRVTRGALSVASLVNAVFSIADELNVLLYIGAAAARSQDSERAASFNGRPFCSFSISVLRGL